MKKVTELPENYWDVVMEWLPDYYHRDEVLRSDILQRYIDDEEVYEKDLEWLPESREEAQKMALELDLDLYNEAMEAKEREMLTVETLEDVRLFFRFLVEDWKLNFHPDTPFEDYINATTKGLTFDADGCARYDAAMKQCFKVCAENGADIYALGYDALIPEEPKEEEPERIQPTPLAEHKKGYYDRHHELRKEVTAKVAELLGERTVSLEEWNCYAIVTERHSGETFKPKVQSITAHSFVTEEGEFELGDMNLGDLCVILDYLITGEW